MDKKMPRSLSTGAGKALFWVRHPLREGKRETVTDDLLIQT